MSKAKMQAAKELIEAKKYQEARALLKTVDHPTAQLWLARLDAMSPPAVTPKKRRWPLVLLIILLIVGAAGILYLKQLNDVTTERVNRALAEMEIRTSLQVYCERESENTKEACQALVDVVMSEAKHDIDYCWEQYGNNNTFRRDCLIQRGVIPR